MVTKHSGTQKNVIAVLCSRGWLSSCVHTVAVQLYDGGHCCLRVSHVLAFARYCSDISGPNNNHVGWRLQMKKLMRWKSF